MAFSYLRNIVGATHKSSASTWSFAPSNTLNAGELGVLVIACDNLDGGDGDFNVVQSVTDSAGNTWQKAAEFTNGQGSAAAGATVSVWYTVATTTLPTTGSITVTFRSALTAKAAIGQAYSIDAASVAVEATVGGADDGRDPSPLSVSSLPSREYLFVRAIASESSSTTALTPSTGFTAWHQAVTSGGGSASNMGARAERRIATDTSAWSDPTLFNADHASVLVALYEVAGAVVTGSANLSGTGSLSASGARVVDGQASLAGSGALSASGQTYVVASCSLSGVGALTAAVLVFVFAAASLTGAGAISASAYATSQSGASLAGIGSLSSSAVGVASSGASLSGTGALSAAGQAAVVSGASLAGTGDLAASGHQLSVASTSLPGAGSLNASASVTSFSGASLAGTGSISATGEVVSQVVTGSAVLSGTGEIAVSGEATVLSGASLPGTGSLSASAVVTRESGAALAGSGALSSSGEVLQPVVTGQASLTGSGQLSVSGSSIVLSGAQLEGVGVLACAGYSLSSSGAHLHGSGRLIIEAPQTGGSVVASMRIPAVRHQSLRPAAATQVRAPNIETGIRRGDY